MPPPVETAQDLINEALQWLGVAEPGETLSSAQYADCLRSLNWMLDEWNTQESLQPALTSSAHQLVANTDTYEMGPYATPPGFLAATPIYFLMAHVLWGSAPYQNRIPLSILSIEEWASGNPVELPGTAYPSSLYFDPVLNANGNMRLVFWPKPVLGLPVELTYAASRLNSQLAITDTLTMKPGYRRAIVTNLAVVLARKFGGNPPADIIQQAATALRNLRNSNRQPIERRDSGAVYWSYVTGSYEKVH